jgi:hypothetical protein
MLGTKALKSTRKENGSWTVGRSGIVSPYFDLAASIKVAQVIHQQGAGTASSQQLAQWLGYKSTNSGTYATRLSAATKHFGLIEYSGDTFGLTERAKIILAADMPENVATAKIEAFLAVPLFSRVYEQFRSSQLPPAEGLKNLFLNTYKILPDRVAHAMRVLLNSAEQAGFFAPNGDRSRLIKPLDNQQSLSQTYRQDDTPRLSTDAVNRKSGAVDPALLSLLGKLPAPGESWSALEQTRFLTALTHTIQFLYPSEDR